MNAAHELGVELKRVDEEIEQAADATPWMSALRMERLHILSTLAICQKLDSIDAELGFMRASAQDTNNELAEIRRELGGA
jgi:hypothetical protein